MYLTVYLQRDTAEDTANGAVEGTDADYAGTDNAMISGGVLYDEYEFFGMPEDLEIVKARLGNDVITRES